MNNSSNAPYRRFALALVLSLTTLSLTASLTPAFSQTPPTTPPAVATTPTAAQPPDEDQPPSSPFLPPSAHIFYAPDRDYDLKHVAVNLTVDYPNRAIGGDVTNTVAPLRVEGLNDIKFHCGAKLLVDSVTVDGATATFRRDGEMLFVASPKHIDQGKDVDVHIVYRSQNQQGTGFAGGAGGFHWLTPTDALPNRIGFWTQGETSGNRLWVPTWDYPNDFATTETTTTVPADWTVIGNGVKVSDKVDKGKGTRTVHWKMDQPHATYLLSLCAGPFEMKEGKWKSTPLLFVVPKGRAGLIDSSFSSTADNIDFYSNVLGVPYAWPKYAQDAMYDFGGGMENVSATTLGANSLQDARTDEKRVVSLTSHELAHQWFGDLVTCSDWGQIWLNESFATFMQTLYFEHRYGKNAYDHEIANNVRTYLREAQRYERPVITHLYPNPDAMFDSHTYPKGGVILHSLRKTLGDAAFFAGLHEYLTSHYDTPVTSANLSEAFTKASGIDVQPFFDQWLYKPGHPVLEWTWTYDDAAKLVTLILHQTQSLKNGTPTYDLPLTVGLLSGGTMTHTGAHTTTTDATFVIPSPTKPDALLIDPDHQFLRDISRQSWLPTELPAIVQYAPNGPDRTLAMRRMLSTANGATPSDDLIALAAEAVAADSTTDPAFETIQPLISLKRESLRPLFRQLLTVPDFSRRAEGVRGLAGLEKNNDDIATLKTLANDTKAPHAAVNAAIQALEDWDISPDSTATPTTASAAKTTTLIPSSPGGANAATVRNIATK